MHNALMVMLDCAQASLFGFLNSKCFCCVPFSQDVERVGIAFADKGGGVLCLKVAVNVTISMANAV